MFRNKQEHLLNGINLVEKKMSKEKISKVLLMQLQFILSPTLHE